MSAKKKAPGKERSRKSDPTARGQAHAEKFREESVNRKQATSRPKPGIPVLKPTAPERPGRLDKGKSKKKK